MPGHTGAHSGGIGPVGTASPDQADRDNAAMRDRQRERMRDPVQAESQISRTRQSQDAVNRAMKDMANRGIVQTEFGPLMSEFGPVQAPGVTANAMAQIDRLSRSIMNPERDRTSLGDIASGIMSSLSPQRVIGSLIGGALFGPIGSFFGGLIGGTYGDDDPSNNFGGVMMNALQTDFSNILGNPVPNFGELNTTTEIGDTFSMPAPSGLRGTTVFGTMPRVTAAPIDSVSQSTNAVDSFGNPVTFGRTSFDPVVETQPIDFRMPMVNPEEGVTNIYPSGPATEIVDPLNPEMGLIMNDPSLMAPNDLAIDPVTGSLIPVVNTNLSPNFSI